MNGEVEPTEDECDWPSDGEEEEEDDEDELAQEVGDKLQIESAEGRLYYNRSGDTPCLGLVK